MSSSSPLLNEIKSAYQRAYPPRATVTEQLRQKIRPDSVNTGAAIAAREDARRQLEEHLSLLCTSILIGGEQFVREFPSQLYVPVLTDILIAARSASAGDGDGTNPLVWDGEEASGTSVTKAGKHPRSTGGHRGKDRFSAAPTSFHYLGFQIASPIELLSTRALALIAGDVPRGSYALRLVKSPETIPVLAAYLSDPELLVVNDELTEELLKCFLYFTLIAHDTCVEAGVPRRIVELLLVVEQHHLQVLCVQILSNMLARSRETELEDVWAPVLALLTESISGFIASSSLQVEAAVASPVSEVGSGPSASPLSAAPAGLPNHRTISAKDRILIYHYMESVVHAIDRLFVEVAAMKCHVRLIEQFVSMCVQLLQTSQLIHPADDAQALRSLVLSPLVTLYLSNPAFAVPLLLRQHVWETVCGCMLSLVERKQLEPIATRMAASSLSPTTVTPADGAAGNDNPSRASATASATSALASGSASSNAAGDDDSTSSLTPQAGEASAQPRGPSATRGPVLTTDVTTIPFIADELRLLPLLEFLLVLMPCARRGHCHSDYRNTTAPYFRWTWEDDFHNEMECNESLCRRLERTYQQTRHFRTHDRYAMTHGKQRVFYADFLSKVYVSDRKQRHSLHRRPLIAGYVHDSRNALLHGCTCCAAEPGPLFTTWATRSNMQLRTAETINSGLGYTSDAVENTENANGEESHRELTRSSSAPSLRVHRDADRPIRSESFTTRTGHSAEHAGGAIDGAGVGGSSSSNGAAGARRLSIDQTRAAAAASETSTVDSRGRTSRGHGTAQGRDHGRPSFPRTNRQVGFHDRDDAGEEEDDNDRDEDEDTLNNDGDSSYQGSRRSTHGGFSLCSCGAHNSTAPRQLPTQRLRVPVGDAANLQNQKRAPITITILPLEVMLEDPVEKLHDDPATRKAFLGKDVLSRLVPTMVPALLSLVDNCVNPLVARHSLTLLLRCLSLCADLRTQVMGEPIELPSNSGVFSATAKPGAATTAASNAVAPAAGPSGKEKSSRRFQSFRKLFTGSSGTISPRWQRAEWQTTQTALQCFVTSLRDLFVGLYLTEGVHIVAARQDVFAAMKDDLLMADELARVHIAPEFCSFQLSLPSEQLMTAADAMVLLMGLFPKAKPTIASPTTSNRLSSFIHKKGSFRRPPLPTEAATTTTATTTASIGSPVTPSLTSFERSKQDGRRSEAASPSPPPIGRPSSTCDDASPSDLNMFAASAATYGAEPRMRDIAVAPLPPASSSPPSQRVAQPRRLSLTTATASSETDGGGGGSSSSPSLSVASPLPSRVPRPPALTAAPLPLSNALHASSQSSAVRASHGPTKKRQPSPPSAALSVATSVPDNSGGVFTVHQATLLLNYARQIVNRGPRVCAAAAQIEQSMQCSEFKSVCVLGTSEPNTGLTSAVLRTKEFTLRLSPASGCPYHFSFSFCTESFFDASLSLLQTLTRSGCDAQVEGADVANVPSTAATAVAYAGAATSLSTSSALLPSSIGPAVIPSATSAAGADGANGDGVAATQTASNQRDQHDNSSTAAQSDASRQRGSVLSSGQPQPDAVVEEDLPIDVTVSVVPKTIDIAALSTIVDRAMRESAGPYHRLPPPLRALLTFYDYCKERNIELRAVVVEVPTFMCCLAEELRTWYRTTVRRREDEALSSTFSLGGETANSPNSEARSPMSGSRHLRMDSTVRGKILRLVCELGATVSRDLGFAMLELAPSIVVKQPCSFAKRAKRMKAFGTVRHLVWRPLTIALEMMGPSSASNTSRAKLGETDSKSREQLSAVMVRNIPLSIVSGVKLRKSTFAVLANTTMGDLAVAVAKQLQMPSKPSSASPRTWSSPRRSAQRSPAAVALHAIQDRHHSSDLAPSSPALGDTSPCLTSEEFFEAGAGGSGSSGAVSADRLLFFINNEPMLSPLTTLLDGLTSYADSGYSLRYLVTLDKQAGDSDEAHRNKIMLTLPTLPFWFCKHDIKVVVLEEPLPMSLLTGNTLTSLWSTPNQRRCGCCGMEPSFFCSPKHLFEAAPESGSIALYAILSAIARGELADEASVLENSQRRLSSAVVHQLYHQLNMFMLPPLLYSSGIGAATHGAAIRTSASTRGIQVDMNFPTASYALWMYPYMFSMEMRVSILRFFISAQRSLSLEQCRHLLQGNQGLLVRRAVGDYHFGPEETRRASAATASISPGQAEGTDRHLDVVGLEWLSEEVLRRRRVTLTVDRRRILHSAEQLFALATCTMTVDVAFKGEAGIGPGPALEFYELIAEELVKPKYGLFRTEEIPDDEAEHGDAGGPAHLLAPSASGPTRQQPRRRSCNPLYPAARQTPQSLHYWELLGLLLGRLLMMGETTSLNFHPLFLRRLLGEEIMSTTTITTSVASNMELLDAPLSMSLRQLGRMSAAELKECDLFFTIPLSETDGFSPLTDEEVPMMPGGEQRRVTHGDVDEYMMRLHSYFLQTVPDLALLHLRRGLQHTVNPLYLELFNATELGRLFGSSTDAKIWESREHFARCIDAGHGYHKRSEVVQYLLDVVPQWNARLQHMFLKFVTGSSSVPYGGLTQAIMVVRRDIDAAEAEGAASRASPSFAGAGGTSAGNGTTVSESAFSAAMQNHSFGANTTSDRALPTVSTCFLYLKLPQYSSKAVLEERLRFAVCEGSNFFALT